MKKKTQYVDKAYKLTRDAAPLSYMLPSHHSRRFPLLHFDQETGVNRPLRYATNQKSPFEDEQDGNAILEPIIFEDGFLFVRKENQVLQQFLHFHPQKGSIFVEVDKAKEASEELDYVEMEINALIEANNLTLEKRVSLARVLLGSSVDKMSSPEIKRDILLFAKNNPIEFLEALDDPMIEIEDNVSQFVSNGFLEIKDKAVMMRTGKKSVRLMGLPFGEEPLYVIASFMQSDEGLPTYKALLKRLK
jgi:hypothetical protein